MDNPGNNNPPVPPEKKANPPSPQGVNPTGAPQPPQIPPQVPPPGTPQGVPPQMPPQGMPPNMQPMPPGFIPPPGFVAPPGGQPPIPPNFTPPPGMVPPPGPGMAPPPPPPPRPPVPPQMPPQNPAPQNPVPPLNAPPKAALPPLPPGVPVPPGLQGSPKVPPAPAGQPPKPNTPPPGGLPPLPPGVPVPPGLQGAKPASPPPPPPPPKQPVPPPPPPPPPAQKQNVPPPPPPMAAAGSMVPPPPSDEPPVKLSFFQKLKAKLAKRGEGKPKKEKKKKKGEDTSGTIPEAKKFSYTPPAPVPDNIPPPPAGGLPQAGGDGAFRGANPFIGTELVGKVRRGRMRMILIVLAVLAVLSLYIIPLFIDWDGYRKLMMTNIEQVTGRKVTMQGDIEFSPLPVPSFRLSGIKLNNVSDGVAATMLEVESMEAKPALIPLMFGKITLNKVVLNKVKIELENFEGGTPNWNFSDGRAAGDVEQGKQVVADYFGVKGVVIKEGTLIFRSGDKANPKVKELNLSEVSIDASSLSGPFDIKGGLRSDDLNFAFESEVGNLASSSPADVKFSLTSGTSRLDIKGEVTNWLTTPTVKGELTANIDRSIDSLLDYFGISRALLPKTVTTVLSSKTTEVKGTLFLSSAGFNLSDVSINSLNTKGSGSIGVTFGNLIEVAVKLAFDNLDIDQMMQEPAADPNATANPEAAAEQAKKATVDKNSLKEFGKETMVNEPQFDLAQNLKFTLALDVKKAKFRGQEVTDVQLEMDMGQGATLIRKLTAKNLPGESVIDVSGKVFEANEAMAQSQRFDSVIVATGKDLLPMIRWLNVDFPDIKPGKLKDYEFNAKISFTQERTTVSEVKLAIDDTYIIGQAVVVKGEVPVANSAFKVGRVNLDDYLLTPDTSAVEGFWDRLLNEQELAQQQRKFDALRHINFSFFKNLGISIAADELIYKGGSYKNFVVVGVLKPNALDVRSLEFESFTGKVKASGTLNTNGLVPEIEANIAIDKFDMRSLREFRAHEPYDPKAKPVWSEKNFFLGKLGVANTKFTLKFGELIVGRLKFQDVDTGGTIDSEMIQVPTFRGKLYGGLLDMKGNMSIGRQTLNVSFSVANASLPQTMQEVFGIGAVTEGRYSASGSIQTAGTNVKSLLTEVQGTGTIAARGLVIQGVDFSKIAGIRFDKPLEEVNRIVSEALVGGQTSIDYLASSITMKGGLADMQNLTVTTSAIDRSALTAQISLPAWEANVAGSVVYGLKYPIAGTTLFSTIDIPLSLKISGPLGDLRPEWDKSSVAVKWREKRFGQ